MRWLMLSWMKTVFCYFINCVFVVCTQVIDPFLSQTEFHSYNCDKKKRNNSNRTQIILAILACYSQHSRLNICAFKTFFRKFKIDFPLFIQQATRESVCVCMCVITVRVHTTYGLFNISSSLIVLIALRITSSALHANTFDFRTTFLFYLLGWTVWNLLIRCLNLWKSTGTQPKFTRNIGKDWISSNWAH